jgi:antitoxin component HigA of HigAB toxin-antitoxin module
MRHGCLPIQIYVLSLQKEINKMDSLLDDNEMDVRDQIATYLEDNGIMKTWLANKIELNQSSLTRILNKERRLTSATLGKINQALNKDFKLK